MKVTASIVIALFVLISMAVVPGRLSAASDDFETLEFFLDQALKRAKTQDEKDEIADRYLVKALGLLYKQNKELVLLQRQTLNLLQELYEVESKEKRELELQLQKR